MALMVEGHARCPSVGAWGWQWHGRLPSNHLARSAFLTDHVQPAHREDPATGVDRIRGGWSAHRGGPLAADAGRRRYRGPARLDRQRELARHSDCRWHRRIAVQMESPLTDAGR